MVAISSQEFLVFWEREKDLLPTGNNKKIQEKTIDIAQ